MLVALGDKPVRRARPGPCPFRWAWACRLDGKTPDSRPLHIPAPDPGPWQTRQCPVEDLRLRAESSLAAVGWGVRRDRKSRTDLDVVDVRQLPVPPLLRLILVVSLADIADWARGRWATAAASCRHHRRRSAYRRG